MSDDGPPTRRDSRSLGIFEMTVNEVLGKLAASYDPIALNLRAEATQLHRLFETWKQDPPRQAERSAAIQRVIDLHRDVEQYLVDIARRDK